MGNRLTEIRESRNLTMRELSKMSGVSKSTISRIESGEVIPTQTVMCKLCKALKLSLNDVFFC